MGKYKPGNSGLSLEISPLGPLVLHGITYEILNS